MKYFIVRGWSSFSHSKLFYCILIKYSVRLKQQNWASLWCEFISPGTYWDSRAEFLLKAGDAVFETLRRPTTGASGRLVMLVVGLGRVWARLWEARVVLILRWRDDVFWLALKPQLERLNAKQTQMDGIVVQEQTTDIYNLVLSLWIRSADPSSVAEEQKHWINYLWGTDFKEKLGHL